MVIKIISKNKEIIVIGILVLILAVVSFNSYQIGKIISWKQELEEMGATGEQYKQPSKIDMKALSDDDPYKGSKNAPITIVEFSDFQCPYCARFHLQTFPQIEENYIKKGKVKFVYRDYPLPFHSSAQKAAEAAECADEQGKFWEMHNIIFENQQSLSIENLKSLAKKLNLDSNKFNDCLDSGKYASEVQKDMADGSAVGVTGTPGFIINGELISGAQPYEVFQQIIEAKLN